MYSGDILGNDPTGLFYLVNAVKSGLNYNLMEEMWFDFTWHYHKIECVQAMRSRNAGQGESLGLGLDKHFFFGGETHSCFFQDSFSV